MREVREEHTGAKVVQYECQIALTLLNGLGLSANVLPVRNPTQSLKAVFQNMDAESSSSEQA